MKRKLTNWVAWYMVTVMFLFGITPKVEAGFSPSEVIGQSQMDRSMDVEKVRKFLETKMIHERLHAFGFSQEEIQARLNLLTDDQIHQVALKLDELKVAGDGGEAVIIVLLIAAIVLLVIYLLGYRVVLKKE
ncbi:MAG TPA: PA2779 family protein [Thermodesulfobacteriota bacterium]|nr:PA2779 family protein [Thermodesulfobacteriota bacterium]